MEGGEQAESSGEGVPLGFSLGKDGAMLPLALGC